MWELALTMEGQKYMVAILTPKNSHFWASYVYIYTYIHLHIYIYISMFIYLTCLLASVHVYVSHARARH